MHNYPTIIVRNETQKTEANFHLLSLASTSNGFKYFKLNFKTTKSFNPLFNHKVECFLLTHCMCKSTVMSKFNTFDIQCSSLLYGHQAWGENKSTAVVLNIRKQRTWEVVVLTIFHCEFPQCRPHTHAESSLFELQERDLLIDMHQCRSENTI